MAAARNVEGGTCPMRNNALKAKAWSWGLAAAVVTIVVFVAGYAYAADEKVAPERAEASTRYVEVAGHRIAIPALDYSRPSSRIEQTIPEKFLVDGRTGKPLPDSTIERTRWSWQYGLPTVAVGEFGTVKKCRVLEILGEEDMVVDAVYPPVLGRAQLKWVRAVRLTGWRTVGLEPGDVTPQMNIAIVGSCEYRQTSGAMKHVLWAIPLEKAEQTAIQFREMTETNRVLKAWPSEIPGDVGDYGRWEVSKSISKIDDTPTVVLSLKADNEITGWPVKTYRPTLYIRHKEGYTEVYINTGFSPQPELEYESYTATYRFDKAKAVTRKFGKSTDGEALFWRDSKAVIGMMVSSDKLVFRFTPYNSNPATITFTLTGLSNAIGEIEKVAGWRAMGRRVTILPLIGDETALRNVKADPLQYIGKKIIVAGGIKVSDSYWGKYKEARTTHVCFELVECRADISVTGKHMRIYAARNIAGPLIDAVSKTEDDGFTYKAIRARICILAFRYDKLWGSELAELLDWQFLNPDRVSWGPWASEANTGKGGAVRDRSKGGKR
ncbi:MAG: hypothetical protein J7M14_00710 [Planctomycetes bacterium]|nr:hypothetical protein [Planctomycetota bacterium]